MATAAALLAATLAPLLSPAPALAVTPGTLDPTFGVGGIAALPNVTVHPGAEPTAVLVQPDGKIVVAGTVWFADVDEEFAVWRYLPNGTRDTTFGTKGAVIGYGKGTDSTGARAAALWADGRIVIATEESIVVLRSNGTRDASFGAGGVLKASVSAFATSGSLLYDIENNRLVRRTITGRLDPTFAGVGQVWLEWPPSDFAVDHSGRPVLAWRDHVRRYAFNGALDTTFAALISGRACSWHPRIAVDANDHLLVAHELVDGDECWPDEENERIEIQRYDDSGAPMGAPLLVTDPRVDAAYYEPTALAVDHTGEIAVGFSAWDAYTCCVDYGDPKDPRAGMARFSPSGRRRFSVIDTGAQTPTSVAFRSQVVLAATETSVTARTADGSLDTSFATAGRLTEHVTTSVPILLPQVVVDSARRSYVLGDVAFTWESVVLRLRSDGSLDPTWGDGGVVYLPIPGARLTLLANGDLAVAGAVLEGAPWQGRGPIAVTFLTSAGRPDKRAGPNGVRLSTTEGGRVSAITADGADGALVASYAVDDEGYASGASVTRITLTGSKLLTSPDRNQVDAIARLSGGRFVTAGDGTIERWSSSGALDTAFHPRVVGSRVGVDSRGRVYTLGSGGGTPGGLIRILSSGAIDATFHNTVVADTLTVGPGDLALVSTWDGKVSRFLTDGSADLSFGDHGVAMVTGIEVWTRGNALATDARGSVYLAGQLTERPVVIRLA